MKSAEPSPSIVDAQPLSAGGGIDTVLTSERDPYDSLQELMAVVEELCPVWPARETFKHHQLFLL